MAFILSHVVGLHDLPQASDLDAATIDAILEEAGKLARDVLDPINAEGQTGQYIEGWRRHDRAWL